MSSNIYIGSRVKVNFGSECGSSNLHNKAIYYKPENTNKYFQLDIVKEREKTYDMNTSNNKCNYSDHKYVLIKGDRNAKHLECSSCKNKKEVRNLYMIANIYHKTGLPENKKDYKLATVDDIPTSALKIFDLLDLQYRLK